MWRWPFSRSGRSVDTVKALRLAKSRGRHHCGDGRANRPAGAGTPISPLSVGGGAQTVYGNAIFSRVADLAVVDMLYMGIILSDYERFSATWTAAGR